MEPVNILLIEDNPADIHITMEALAELDYETRLLTARDGEEGMDILRRAQASPDAPYPDLVLLDLNMPKKNGWEVLREMKGDEQLRRIPVVVLTSSREDEDVLRAYNLYANGFMVKAMDLDRYIAMLDGMISLWFDIMRLPPRI